MHPPDCGHVLEGGRPVGDGEEDLPDHPAEEHKVQAGRDAGQDDEAQREVRAHRRHPDRVEGVLQLHPPLAHVKDEEAEAADHDRGEVLPVGTQARRLAAPTVVDEVLAGKHEPEAHQAGVEDALLDVVEQVDPGHVEGEGEVLEGQVEEGQGGAEPEEHLLQEAGLAGQLADPSPVPDHLADDDGKEDGLEAHPDLGEAAVLVDGHQPEVGELSEVVDVPGHVLVVEVDVGKAEVEEVVVVVEGAEVEEGKDGAVVQVAGDLLFLICIKSDSIF